MLVHLATEEGPLRLAANALADVQAISYRADFESLLACGAWRTLEPVFVTWRPGGTAAGTIVALEFLGNEYRPRPFSR